MMSRLRYIIQVSGALRFEGYVEWYWKCGYAEALN